MDDEIAQIAYSRRHQSMGSPTHSIGGRSRGSVRRRRGRMLQRHRSSGALTHTGHSHANILLSMQSPSFRSVRSSTHEVVTTDDEPGGGGRNRNARQNKSNAKQSAKPMSFKTVVEALMYGLVNSIVAAPCLFGYALIIYRAPVFHDQLPALSKLVLFSSVVHQLVFTLMSSLSFSIGQVQDAGLVFLSAAATSVAHRTSDDPSVTIPTTLVTLSLSTAFLGLVVFLIGKLRLANLVAYLPMPVVGGYLAFIGWFCLEAGLSQSTALDIAVLPDLLQLNTVGLWVLAAPALAGGWLLAYVSHKTDHWMGLPIAIMFLPAMFYLCLWLGGWSLQDARDGGWVEETTPDTTFIQVFSLFDFEKVRWEIVPGEVVTWVSMMSVVVAFSSCLDVVAIEMDMGQELDVNHELSTVGLSNIVSGLLGGLTGSYIFSQTIFTYRTKTDSRLVGVVVIISELALFLYPKDVRSFVPKFFFAACLLFIALDLLAEWLYLIYFRVSWREYFVVLCTFGLMVLTNNLIGGIALGIALSILNFIYCYVSVDHVKTEQAPTSNTQRDFESGKLLAKRFKRDVSAISLHGYLFFGSTNQIVSRVRKLIAPPETPSERQEQQDVRSQYGSLNDNSFGELGGVDKLSTCARLKNLITCGALGRATNSTTSLQTGRQRRDEEQPLLMATPPVHGRLGSFDTAVDVIASTTTQEQGAVAHALASAAASKSSVEKRKASYTASTLLDITRSDDDSDVTNPKTSSDGARGNDSLPSSVEKPSNKSEVSGSSGTETTSATPSTPTKVIGNARRASSPFRVGQTGRGDRRHSLSTREHLERFPASQRGVPPEHLLHNEDEEHEGGVLSAPDGGDADSLVGMSEANLGTVQQVGTVDVESQRACDEENENEIAPRFLVLDFSRVTGMDSTAISTGLLRVKQLAVMHDIFVVFVGVRPTFQRLLLTNGIVADIREDDSCVMFSNIEDGLDWIENEILLSCENQLIMGLDNQPEMPAIPFAFNVDGSLGSVIPPVFQRVHASTGDSATGGVNAVIETATMQRIFFDFFNWHVDSNLTESFCGYFGLMRLRKNEVVFDQLQDSDSIFIVLCGEVVLFDNPTMSAANEHVHMDVPNDSSAIVPQVALEESDQHRFPFVHEESSGRLIPSGRLLRRSRYGSMFGEKDFCLERTRRFTAVVMADETALFFLTRERYNEMSRVHPQLALGFHQCVTKSLALEIDRGNPQHW